MSATETYRSSVALAQRHSRDPGPSFLILVFRPSFGTCQCSTGSQ